VKDIARHALAVMALITAALGQQQGDSLSASIEKAQALDKEALRVCHAVPVDINWQFSVDQARRAEQWEMKPADVLMSIQTDVMFVRGAIVVDLADCAHLQEPSGQKMTLKLQAAIWDLDHAEQQLLQKRLLNTLLMDEIQAKQKEH